MAIVESSTIGRRSCHNNPLVIHAVAVAANTPATRISSPVIRPSSDNFFPIIPFSSATGFMPLILTPILTMYSQATTSDIALIGKPTISHSPNVISTPAKELDKDASIALGGVPIKVDIPPKLAEYATESMRQSPNLSLSCLF